MEYLKVGDRVKCIGVVGIDIKPRMIGSCGTVIDLRRRALVEFDEYVDGHDGSDYLHGKKGHCWFFNKNNPEILEKIGLYAVDLI